MTLASLEQLNAQARRAASELDPAALPDLIAALEGAKAIAWSRLARPATPAAQAEGEELVTAKALAQQLHISEGWLLEKARQGQIPCRRFGRWRRFSRAEVERSLAAAEDSDPESAPLGTTAEPNGRRGPRGSATTTLPLGRMNGGGK